MENSETYKKWMSFKKIRYLYAFIHQGQLVNNISNVENYFLFVVMLSPVYKIRTHELFGVLRESFKNSGGVIKEHSVGNIVLDRNSPWAVEFNSYEGAIFPQEVSFMKGLIRNRNFRILPNKNVFRNINFEFALTGEFKKKF